jgi:radical SAM protein with 4Fe4S-binding SPASM domain
MKLADQHKRVVSQKRSFEDLIDFQTKKYGNKYLEYKQKWDLALNFEYEPDFPLYIMLEQTYKCPLRCVSCVQGYPGLRTNYDLNKSGNLENRMSLEMYKRIIEESAINGLPSVSMHNNDEPLLIKDVHERIAFAHNKGIMDIIFTTGGTLFNEKRLKEIMDAGVTHLCISVDALTRETYTKVREGGDFDKVNWAINEALKIRTNSGSTLPLIRVSWVTNTYNEHELEGFIDHYSDIVDYIDIQPLFLGTTGTKEERKIGDITTDSKSIIPKRSKKLEDYRCDSPWTTLVIRGNGDVITCPNFSGAKQVMGNINESSIKEIWNTTYKDLRYECRDGEYSLDGCKECADSIYVVESEKL